MEYEGNEMEYGGNEMEHGQQWHSACAWSLEAKGRAEVTGSPAGSSDATTCVDPYPQYYTSCKSIIQDRVPFIATSSLSIISLAFIFDLVTFVDLVVLV